MITRSEKTQLPESSLIQIGKIALAKIGALNAKQEAVATLKHAKLVAVELQERGSSIQNTYDQAYQKDPVRTGSYLGTFLFTSITTGVLVRSEVAKNSSEVAKNASEVAKNSSEVAKNASEISKNVAIEKLTATQEFAAQLQANELLAKTVQSAVGLVGNGT